MNIVLYSTGCSKCKILEKKLNSAGFNYDIITDVDMMQNKGFTQLPMLEIDGEIIDFGQAVKWISERADK